MKEYLVVRVAGRRGWVGSVGRHCMGGSPGFVVDDFEAYFISFWIFLQSLIELEFVKLSREI